MQPSPVKTPIHCDRRHCFNKTRARVTVERIAAPADSVHNIIGRQATVLLRAA